MRAAVYQHLQRLAFLPEGEQVRAQRRSLQGTAAAEAWTYLLHDQEGVSTHVEAKRGSRIRRCLRPHVSPALAPHHSRTLPDNLLMLNVLDIVR